MDIDSIVKEAVAKILKQQGSKKSSKAKTSAKTTGKKTCEAVTTANAKAQKEGFPLLLTKSKAKAKSEGFKTTKAGDNFTCRDCGALCRTYGVLMNHYRTQKGKTVKAK